MTPGPIGRFQALLAIPTFKAQDPAATDWSQYERFRSTVRTLYPQLHQTLEFELVDGHTMLYRWAGATPGSPTVLMAHYDVVPADEDGWEHPPFAGEVSGEGDDAVLWGRGTLDDKGALVAVLEAVEDAVTAGLQPAHDVWLCFGHDEETHGTGASSVVDLLQERGVAPALVLDEGGAIVDGLFPGVDRPIAVVGVAEKGSANYTLSVAQQGGHAFAPPRLPATGRLARAISRVGAVRFRPRVTEPVRAMNRVVGAAARGATAILLRGLGWCAPLITAVFGRLGPETTALTRTTAVVTMVEAGHAANALPERGRATVNVRILPGETTGTVLERLRTAIADERVQVALVQGGDPPPPSPAHGPAWDLIEQTITARHPGVLVTPYLMLGATDARHFTRISEHVYRFSPFEMSAAERSGLHGMNERIRLKTWLDGVAFYRALLDRL